MTARPPIHLRAAAVHLPPRRTDIAEIFEAEGVRLDTATSDRLGIERVHVFEGEAPTEMALEASLAALREAGMDAGELDAIIDFSVMPQRYVEPAWSMSNELQHELGAKVAFTLGFSGGGSANLHVALKFALALIAEDEDVDTVLLAASDCAIAGNRIIGGTKPVTVIGDGASALIVSRTGGYARIEGVFARTNGAYHNVLYIPGGGMAHPERLDLYRLTLDEEKYRQVDGPLLAHRAGEKLAGRHGGKSDIAHVLGANLSLHDLERLETLSGVPASLCRDVLRDSGHIHSTSLVMNLMELRRRGISPGSRILLASHGFGFTSGAALLSF